MKSLLTLAAVGLLALSAPAFAQDAGSPGASGVGGGMSGSNTGSRPATNNNDSNKLGGTGPASGAVGEGRATSTDTMTNTPGDPANPAPDTVRGDQNRQDMAK
jgi:hypothetical protein